MYYCYFIWELSVYIDGVESIFEQLKLTQSESIQVQLKKIIRKNSYLNFVIVFTVRKWKMKQQALL